MPPKPTVSRSEVIKASLDVIREGGLSNLSARNVANFLGCSTHPVYRIFKSMEELQAAVLNEIMDLAISYLTHDYGKEIPPFFQVGLGSLHFAQDEPELANILAYSGPMLMDMKSDQPPPPFILDRMRSDPVLKGLSDHQLTRLNAQLWIFSQGLTSFFKADEVNKTEAMEQAKKQLRMAGEAFIRFEKLED